MFYNSYLTFTIFIYLRKNLSKYLLKREFRKRIGIVSVL